MKKLLFLTALLVATNILGQSCPALLNPVAGATDVPVESVISWEEIPGVPGYLISLGTTNGGGEIVSNRAVGSANFFVPPIGLPENTQIFVTITLFFFDGTPNQVCTSLSFRTEVLTTVPECTELRNPSNGQTGVNFRSNISWNYAPGATNYILLIGTTPGGSELLPPQDQNVGNVLTFNPTNDFPLNTQIFVTIIPENRLGLAINCEVQSFMVQDIEVNLGCSRLVNPSNGDSNVPLTVPLEWEAVPGASAYIVNIGLTPNGSEIITNQRINGTVLPLLEFEPNRTIFVSIVPINDLGEALDCVEESFSTAQGCGPFLDRVTGELVSLFPEFDFADTFSTCAGSPPFTIRTDVVAESYRWVSTTSFGSVEEVLSETQEVEISEGGFYQLEVTNFADPNGNNIPCTTIKEFVVEVIEGPTVESIDVARNGENLELTVNVTGPSVYEFALNDIDGPYQSSNVFPNAPLGDNVVFVRDLNQENCIVTAEIVSDSIRDGFPKFFTPNGDNTNEFWQFQQPPNTREVVFRFIQVFDRFGTLIAQIEQESQGWDGTFNGRPLPAGGYWFRAVDDTDLEIQGFFTLKR